MDDLKESKSTDKDGSETFKYYFDLHDNDSPMDTVYIVDESSMISNKKSEGEFFRFGSGLLLNDLMDYIYTRDPNSTRKILFIGDNAQLPPVNMNFYCQIDEYEMTDGVRQETDSGILENATILRDKIRNKSFNKFELNTNYDDIVEIKHDDLVDTYFDCIKRNENDDSVIVTYTNSSVKNYNDSIRARLYPIE